MLKEKLGLNPIEVRQNVYTPSATALALMRKTGSGYKKHRYDYPYKGPKKVLVICTEDDLLQTANGKYFLTGNHPVEAYVPLLHLESAGFGFDMATPTGKSAKLEEWAIPPNDADLRGIIERTKEKRANPLALPDALTKMTAGEYVALFIPGGHGAILGLPQDKNVRAALEYFKANDLHIISLCHGPAAFLAAAGGATNADYLFKGCSITAFPDFLDKQLPKTGYLPGPMPWFFGERLKALGVRIVASLGTGKTHVDRKLITGDGPLAANKLGRLTADALLKSADSKAK